MLDESQSLRLEKENKDNLTFNAGLQKLQVTCFIIKSYKEWSQQTRTKNLQQETKEIVNHLLQKYEKTL